jgi:hypothetical protein
MGDDSEYQEAQRLVAEINRVAAAINRELDRQAQLIAELDFLMRALPVLTANTAEMGRHVHSDLGELAERVKGEELNADALLGLLQNLSERYFAYKNLSTATKTITQSTDEYHTKFAYYHELRRVTLGYVVGLDSHIVSSEMARKKVEKAYLQNSEYWLTYCITATMLWASDEHEAATRAVNKALSLNPAKASLFFLLVSLRFARLDAAVKWYSYYLDKVDASKLGGDWQYLLQAYLSGALGGSHELEARAQERFSAMIAQVQVANISYDKDVASRAFAYAKAKPHVTEFPFSLLRECCNDHEALRQLLTAAERNALLAEEFSRIAAEEAPEGVDLAATIENTLYNLIEAMDADEERVYKRIKHNEFIVAAKGNLALAQIAYDERYPADQRSNFGDLLIGWAFSDGDVRVSPVIRRFSLSFLKDWIGVGLKQFAEDYRRLEQERYEIAIGGWSFSCSEDEGDLAVQKFEDYYGKNKWKDFVKDKFVLTWGAAVAVSLAILVFLLVSGSFVSSAVVVAVLLGICGAFLLWRRVVDLNAALADVKRVNMERIRKVLIELGDWRKAYRAEDAAFADVQQSLAFFD